MDRIAAEWAALATNFSFDLRLCSPTRGDHHRPHHHSVGFGVVGEISTGFPVTIPSSRSRRRPHRHYPEGERVRHLWFGKGPQHTVVPVEQQGLSINGPNGMGFEYFYGFVGGDASQWQPNLFRTRGHLSFPGQSQLEPGDGHGRRGIQHIKQLKEIAT